MKFIWAVVLSLVLSVSAFAQSGSGVTPANREAFLQGQLDAQHAQITGDTLDSYCQGYASSVRAQVMLGWSVAWPVECQQFWTYVDIYGPQFWYSRVYFNIYGSFPLHYGQWHRYRESPYPSYRGAPSYRGDGGRRTSPPPQSHSPHSGTPPTGHAQPRPPASGSGHHKR